MNKLLKANFSRLRKDKVFWIETVFMFVWGIFLTVGPYLDDAIYDSHNYFDQNLLVYVAFIGCCASVFCSMFSGTEYSNGTIRNKLVVGHLRSSIYLSNLITCIASAMIMTAVFLLSYCTVGAFLSEPPIAKPKELIFLIFISLFTVVAYVSIFNMLSMLITKKSISAILCLLLFFGLLILAFFIKGRLDAPEFTPEYGLTANGIELLGQKPNPKFLQPAARRIYQCFLDILPTGQSIELSMFSVVHPYLMMVYSVVISVITTILGIFIFRKKDIK